MNKFIVTILFILLLIPACSLNDKTSAWKKNKKTNTEIVKKKNTKKLFETSNIIKKELNPTLKIELKKNPKQYNYDEKKTKITKFKLSKTKNFNQINSKIIFYKNDLIFYDSKGSIIRFNKSTEKVWTVNNYSKEEKKSNPLLFLENKDEILIVADSISKFYAVNINNGNIIWSKKNVTPFNSKVKIYDNKFFIIDYENILHCYSLKTGEQIWSYKTENVLIKSQKKLSIKIEKDIVYFNNSIGDITALDVKQGKLIWQLPTQNNNIYAQSFSLKGSDLTIDKKSIYFSNNNNEFFSVNLNNGNINWQQKINSSIQPILYGDIIISVSNEGLLIFLNKVTGKLIRITDTLKVFKEKKKSQIHVVGFVIGTNKIFITTSNGRLLIIDIKTGKNEKIIKIDGNKISKPFINNNMLFVIKNKAIIKFD